MVEISGKYKIGTRRFGSINWIGAWTLYKKEVLRFLIVWIQTLFSPDKSKKLNPDGIKSSLKVLNRFKEILDISGVLDLEIIATAA